MRFDFFISQSIRLSGDGYRDGSNIHGKSSGHVQNIIVRLGARSYEKTFVLSQVATLASAAELFTRATTAEPLYIRSCAVTPVMVSIRLSGEKVYVAVVPS